MLGAHAQKKEGKTKITKAEDWLVYVYKKQEGPVMQYYILPEFDYNAVQAGFVSDIELGRMKEFFSDSRELFGEHNKNVQERLVKNDSSLTSLYKKYLTSYYSVWLSDATDDLLLKKNAIDYLHATLDDGGKEFVLSGVCDSLDQAKGNARFIKDCGLSQDAKLVKVYPNRIEVLEP